MMSYLDLPILEIHAALVARKTTPLELTEEAFRRAKLDKTNCFECLCEKEALAFASALTEPEPDNLLWGIPYVAKDNFSTKGIETTASSNVLAGYVPLFDATVIAKLKQRKCVLIGKTTLDELAMGGTGATGRRGKTTNPYDELGNTIIGGSSCGSASAVAQDIVPFALGSDTGDSVRKPASFAGLVGMKPTWGRISRYGLFPFAPSLDHVAFFTRYNEDSKIVYEALAGRDELDATSSSKSVQNPLLLPKNKIKGRRFAIISEILDSVTDEKLLQKFNRSAEMLQERGAMFERVEFGLDLLESIYATYIVISSAEATSNNANLDGIKFGPSRGGKTYQEVMANARTQGFSELIRRRFVIGSFALMKENRDTFLLRAQRNRARLVERVNQILDDYDFIYVPAAPSVAPRFDSFNVDSLTAPHTVADSYLPLGNFAGLPSITLPLGLEGNLPLGVNITGKAFEEALLYQACDAIEEITGLGGLSANNKKEGRL